MATSADGDSPEIGKSPEEVDESLPSDEQVLAHLQEQAETASASDQDDLPSREELWQVVQQQAEQMEQMQERIEDLERQVDEVEQEADTIEEVAEQFRKGKIGGEAGANFIREFVDVPDSNNLVNARSKQLFFRIIEERRVGKPVTSSKVVQWLGLHDSANPSVKAKRVMERLERHREDGYLIGEIETGKYRGKNCIWLKRQ